METASVMTNFDALWSRTEPPYAPDIPHVRAIDNDTYSIDYVFSEGHVFFGLAGIIRAVRPGVTQRFLRKQGIEAKRIQIMQSRQAGGKMHRIHTRSFISLLDAVRILRMYCRREDAYVEFFENVVLPTVVKERGCAHAG